MSEKKKKLTAKQAKFVEEYLVDLNATQACIRAGYSSRTADRIGPELLGKTCVALAIREAMEERSKRTEITQDMVLRRWWDIATADPNELMQYRRECCRYCWGIGHNYQWTESEYSAAQIQAEESKEDSPIADGGFGFDPHRAPHAKCPECHGDGMGKMFVHDTRKLSPAARSLYAGVKVSKEGLAILTQSQETALANVARHLGMFNDKLDLTINEGVVDRILNARRRAAGK